MIKKCPYTDCTNKNLSSKRTVIRTGRYRRKSDGQWIPRFWCRSCKKTFSSATFNECYRQKKRQKNEIIRRLLSGGISQREAARVLKINRKTVVRKFLFLGQRELVKFRNSNLQKPLALEVEFDDMETFEHSKCKPLSITLVVEYKTRRILDFEVSQMPAKGHLSKKARKKYGFRKDFRSIGRKELFKRVQPLVHKNALIRSDSNPYYPKDVRRFFPLARYETILGGRGAVTGQGELKKLKFDPIFSLNHTCAMYRANVNRLFRKTWCTTKKKERLALHLAIYANSHNRRLSTA
jgi:transposase-like protein